MTRCNSIPFFEEERVMKKDELEVGEGKIEKRREEGYVSIRVCVLKNIE